MTSGKKTSSVSAPAINQDAAKSTLHASKRTVAEPDQLMVDMQSEKGRLTVVGTAMAVIAALAVIGLIVLSLCVVQLAMHAIDHRNSGDPVHADTR